MNENLVKVYFDLEDETESLWAEPCFNSDSPTTFKLRNSPFAVKGISFCDIVYAVPREMSGGYEFREVVARGGHSTIWVFENNEARGAFDVYWPRLEALGCSY